MKVLVTLLGPGGWVGWLGGRTCHGEIHPKGPPALPPQTPPTPVLFLPSLFASAFLCCKFFFFSSFLHSLLILLYKPARFLAEPELRGGEELAGALSLSLVTRGLTLPGLTGDVWWRRWGPRSVEGRRCFETGPLQGLPLLPYPPPLSSVPLTEPHGLHVHIAPSVPSPSPVDVKSPGGQDRLGWRESS